MDFLVFIIAQSGTSEAFGPMGPAEAAMTYRDACQDEGLALTCLLRKGAYGRWEVAKLNLNQ